MKKIIAGLLGLGIALAGLGGVAQAAPPVPNPNARVAVAKPVDTRLGVAVKPIQPPKFLPDGKTLTPARKATDLPDVQLAASRTAGALSPKRVPIAKDNVGKGVPQAKAMSSYLYRYATGWDDKGGTTLDTEGVYAQVRIAKPAFATFHYHSLGEIAAVRPSVNGRQIIEVGYTVDRVLNGGSVEPHLFVGAWVNEGFKGYNAGQGTPSGFVDYGPTLVNAGANLGIGGLAHTGTAKQMSILYSGGAWWTSYNNQWIGYYPDSLWTGATPAASFTSMQRAQLFGEVVVDGVDDCQMQMGTGIHAQTGGVPNTGAAYFSSGGYTETSGPAPAMDVFAFVTAPHTEFSIHKVSGRTFYYGGPGVTAGC